MIVALATSAAPAGRVERGEGVGLAGGGVVRPAAAAGGVPPPAGDGVSGRAGGALQRGADRHPPERAPAAPAGARAAA